MVNSEKLVTATTTPTGARYRLPVRPQVAWIGTARVAMGCLGAAAALLCAADSFSQADTGVRGSCGQRTKGVIPWREPSTARHQIHPKHDQRDRDEQQPNHG
jgi:hypothetical protein